jgi:hypothetical protein
MVDLNFVWDIAINTPSNGDLWHGNYIDISLQCPFTSNKWKTPPKIEHVMSKWNDVKN